MADLSKPELPLSVEQLITTICTEQNLPPIGPNPRRELSLLEEEEALSILRTIASSRIKKSLDGFIMYMIKQRTSTNDAPNKKLRYSPPSSGNGSPNNKLSSSSPSPHRSPTTTLTPTRLMMHQQCESVFSSPVPEQPNRAGVTGQEISPELEALGELEFRKSFLILSYLGGRKLENFLSADHIRGFISLSMEKFEAEVWKLIGYKCDYIKEPQRAKYLSWDSGKTHIYHCHVHPERYYTFKGPYLSVRSNLLQRTLGDDNVLIVKVAEDTRERSSTSRINYFYDKYGWLARDGILVGLRRYRFFVFKDGGKEEKKKDPTTSPVKCYFIRMESHASIDNSEYVLHGKTIREARSIFMNVDTLPSLSKYMARLSLILSKTVGLDVDLSCVNIERIDDILCRDHNGNVVKDKDGKLLIHTDGTGFISEDLALKCQNHVLKGKCLNASIVENLLIQFRLFNNGSAVKGIFLLNKKLPPGTMQVRPSMIKVEPSSTPNGYTINSMEIVGIGTRPKRACLSKTLITLLSYGGVPNEFFMDILNNSLEETRGALSSRRTALQVAINHGEMDAFIAVNMILSGIPLEDSYLQCNLRKWMDEEKKSLKGGKLPLLESYYVMGTTDPTGLLESDEVCIILENGHLSGKVLVYRNPGLHFGDIHVLKARYVKELEDFVGNAKYAIFFPCKGPRSLADEIATGDFDGDMYFVSRNPKLLEYYKPSEPWTSASPSSNVPTKKPSEFSNEELEDELFKLYLTNRFTPSYTVGTAADSCQAIMDRLLTLGNNRKEESDAMKRNILELIDIYYDALDAPKQGGGKIVLPEHLKAELYPHYMGREDHSYNSTSILGLIYDRVCSYGEENQAKVEVQKLPCFTDKATDSSFTKWNQLYCQYRQEMYAALSKTTNKDSKNEAAGQVLEKYKEILYEAPDFEESKRRMADIFDEALAIYEVCYDYAMNQRDAGRCSFAWKIAGQALCKYYIVTQNEQLITCSPQALKEIFS
ncbi:probable RNA-dependent RNA polymerase 5 [Euphorbia lathyris]|uniref:probable RNA-dependent RNA polymerase 5 n=1 Tax=Euphorbia lathyris TaxID=212925 RepID=UPI003313D851